MTTIYKDMRDLAYAVHEAISPIDVNVGHVRNFIRDELSRHRNAWGRFEDIDRPHFHELCDLVQRGTHRQEPRVRQPMRTASKTYWVPPKGIVTTEHTVWCCNARRAGIEGMPFRTHSMVGHPQGCESYYQHAGSTVATIRMARESGWVRTSEFGWLCPPCAQAWQMWKKILKGHR